MFIFYIPKLSKPGADQFQDTENPCFPTSPWKTRHAEASGHIWGFRHKRSTLDLGLLWGQGHVDLQLIYFLCSLLACTQKLLQLGNTFGSGHCSSAWTDLNYADSEWSQRIFKLYHMPTVRFVFRELWEATPVPPAGDDPTSDRIQKHSPKQIQSNSPR